MTWDDAAERFFNPTPTIGTVALPGDNLAVVIDDVLLDPDGLVAWPREQAFHRL